MEPVPYISPERFVDDMAWLSFAQPEHPAALMTPKEIIDAAVYYYGRDAVQGLKIWIH